MTNLAELAAILKTTEKNASTRAVSLRLTPVCSRCAGSGRYSFNGSHSICYRCDGAACDPVTPNNIGKVIEAARAAADDGRLETYIERIRAAAEIRASSDKMFAAWHASAAAKGNPHHCKRDEECNAQEIACRLANSRISAAYDAFSKVRYKTSAEIEIRDAIRNFFSVIEETEKELAGA